MNLQLAKIYLKYESLIEQFKANSKQEFYDSDLDICEIYIEKESPHFQVGICDLNILSDSFGIFYIFLHVPKNNLEAEIKKENIPSKFKITTTPRLGLYQKAYIIGYYQNSSSKIYCYLNPLTDTIISDNDTFLDINLNKHRSLDIWDLNKKLFTKEEKNEKIQSILNQNLLFNIYRYNIICK